MGYMSFWNFVMIDSIDLHYNANGLKLSSSCEVNGYTKTVTERET